MGETKSAWNRLLLEASCVVVTGGPFCGRIGFNDDDEWFERDWLIECGSYSKLSDYTDVIWGVLSEDDNDTEPVNQGELGTGCGHVYFGPPMATRHNHIIPHSHLKVALGRDLFKRYDELSQIFSKRKFGLLKISDRRAFSLMQEFSYIAQEILDREMENMKSPQEGTRIFLCHASEDKELVREVYTALRKYNVSPWMDEFEIKVGESIVGKINDAATTSDFVIFFISRSSVKKAWVQKEWNAFLARSLSGCGIKVIPALLDNTEIPAILSDIKYADFRKSFLEPFGEILQALPQKT